MDCIYTVSEFYGNYGGYVMGYLERQSICGKTAEFFLGNTAYIDFRVREQDGGFWCEFEVSTIEGEMVAMDRWLSRRHVNVYFAKANTIKKAISKTISLKSDVNCKIGALDANNVEEELRKRGEKEQQSELN